MPKLNWFQRRSYLEQKKQICQQLQDCDFDRYPRLYCTLLPELDNVVEAETRHWMHLVADEFLDGNTTLLQSKIGVLFTKRDSIPMNDLIAELECILAASGLT
jgi:hypothetical protein